MIPLARIRFRPTEDPDSVVREFQRRLTDPASLAGVTFRSVRYRCRPDGRCVGRSFFAIPYLPVLVPRVVGNRLEVWARPSLVELLGLTALVLWMRYMGFSTLQVLGFALLYHVGGYVCFKLAVSDLRPVFAELADSSEYASIGWP